MLNYFLYVHKPQATPRLAGMGSLHLVRLGRNLKSDRADPAHVPPKGDAHDIVGQSSCRP